MFYRQLTFAYLSIKTIPAIHSADPIPMFSVNFSFKSKVEKTNIDRKDRVIATGYATFRFILDNTYSQVTKPAIYNKIPEIKFKLNN